MGNMLIRIYTCSVPVKVRYELYFFNDVIVQFINHKLSVFEETVPLGYVYSIVFLLCLLVIIS